MTLPFVKLDLAKAIASVETIVVEYIFLIAAGKADHILMYVERSRRVFHRSLYVGPSVGHIAWSLREQFDGRNACTNADEQTDSRGRASMFVHNIIVRLRAGIIASKAAILEPHVAMAIVTHTSFDSDRREVLWRCRGCTSNLPNA